MSTSFVVQLGNPELLSARFQSVPDDITYDEAKELLFAQPDNPGWWYLLHPNIVPLMTHPLSQYWDQPSSFNIGISDSHAAMDQQTLRDLPDYSYSQPTGCYPGKMWKSFSEHEKVWYLHWYGYSEKGSTYCSVNSRQIILI